jgi:anti-sigma factor RsiW
MSEESTQPETRPCGADVAAYALGALDAGEVEAFRRHLDSCVVCRDELAAFQHVVDVLPLSATEVSRSPDRRAPPSHGGELAGLPSASPCPDRRSPSGPRWPRSPW